MTTHTSRFGSALLAAGILIIGASGCELIASVDRSLIPTGDASTEDSSVDSGTDSSMETDSSVTPEAGGDSSPGTDSGPGPDSSTTDSGGGKDGAAEGGGDGGDGGGKTCDGGAMACTMASQCTAQTTLCVTNTCTSGCCGTSDAPSGTTCSDNGGSVCNSAGQCVACNTANDCPAQTTTCKANTCTTNVCGTVNASAGKACSDSGGTVCNGNGSCVAATCSDMLLDGNETDVDCGGSMCPPCADGKMCKVGGDCTDKVCSSGSCKAPTCSDGVQNGNETDVDCGGAGFGGNPACPKCVDLKHCGSNADCTNNFCFGTVPGTCVSCVDGVKDGNETDVDCGGTQCDALMKTCANGKGCGVGTDCQNGVCQSNVCGLLSGGGACTANNQCASNVCGIGGTGNCCTAACITAGACGATGCDSMGACVYPGNSVATPGQTPGDCQKIVCNGAGGTTSVNDATDLPTPTSVCETNPACTGTPLAPSFTPAATGTDCTADNKPPNHLCGNTTVPAIAGTCVECNTSADCLFINDAGTLTCNTATGTCM